MPIWLYFVNHWEWPVMLGLSVVMLLAVLPLVDLKQFCCGRPAEALRQIHKRSPHRVRPLVHCWFVLCLLSMGFVNVYRKFMAERAGLYENPSLEPANYPDDDGGFSAECESSRACAEESLDLYVKEAVRAQDNFFIFISTFFLCAVLHLCQPSYQWSLGLCASQLLVFVPCFCTSVVVTESDDFVYWVAFRIIFTILLLALLLVGSHVHEVQRRQFFVLMHITRKRNEALHDFNMRLTREVRGEHTRSARSPGPDLTSPLYKVIKTLNKMQEDPLLAHWQVELEQLTETLVNNMQSLLRPNLPGVSQQMKRDSMMAQLVYELPKSRSLSRAAATCSRARVSHHPRESGRSGASCSPAVKARTSERFSAPGNCYAGSSKRPWRLSQREQASPFKQGLKQQLGVQGPTNAAGAESAASERTSESFGHGRQSAADSVLSSLRSLRTRVSTVASEALTVDEAADGGGPSKERLSVDRALGLQPTQWNIWDICPEIRPQSGFQADGNRWVPRALATPLQASSSTAQKLVRSALTSWDGHPNAELMKQYGVRFASRDGDGPYGVFAMREIFGDELLPLYLAEAVKLLCLDSSMPWPLQMDALWCFGEALTRHYLPVPYHNIVHVCDVVQSSVYIMWSQLESDGGEALPPLAMLAFLIAAAVHDVAHPGVNNNFLISTHAPLALLYNDQHPLENMHVSLGLQLLLQPPNNFIASIPQPEFRQLRDWIIDAVLATDLSQHFESLERLNLKAAKGALGFSGDDMSENERNANIALFLKNALHAADVGSVGKTWPLYLAWMQRVFEEFFAQGDREKALGGEPAPFMDRVVSSIPKAQQGFITFICLPLMNALAGLYPQLIFICDLMRQNVGYLQQLEGTESQQILHMPLTESHMHEQQPETPALKCS